MNWSIHWLVLTTTVNFAVNKCFIAIPFASGRIKNVITKLRNNTCFSWLHDAYTKGKICGFKKTVIPHLAMKKITGHTAEKGESTTVSFSLNNQMPHTILPHTI